MPPPQSISPLVLDEYFAAGDARFLPAILEFHEPKKLAAIADRWKKDHRPWARERIFEYLDHPMNAAGHEPVVKRLFKWAEERGDDELTAAFAVAFDRLVRRARKIEHGYDWRTRESWEEERLVSPRDVIKKGAKRADAPTSRIGRNPATGEEIIIPLRQKEVRPRPSGKLFSYHTRYYLRRRAWRYFRRRGFKRDADYCSKVAKMLGGYVDAYVAAGENMLDCWSLMHACFRHGAVLEFSASAVNLKDGQNLGDLAAAPEHEELWKEPGATKVLIALLSSARCQVVRVWDLQMLRRHHLENLAQLTPDDILKLLDHSDEQVQQLAAEVLDRMPGVANFDVATWLKLLETTSPAALEIITRLMSQHVRPERLTLEQMVEIACAQPVPVARMGLKFLRDRRIVSDADRAIVAGLARARSAGVAGEIAAWALSIIGSADHYNVEHVSRFFDSLLEISREAAWAWLMPNEGAVTTAPAKSRAIVSSPGYSDPALWSRLIETPYDDVRFHVVAELNRRSKLPGTRLDQITFIWTTVLLGIHRGGRAKLTALKQISRAIADDPQQAEPLLPVLAVAIRSVRLPEVRTGLAALVCAIEAHPRLAGAVARFIPEFQLAEEAQVAG